MGRGDQLLFIAGELQRRAWDVSSSSGEEEEAETEGGEEQGGGREPEDNAHRRREEPPEADERVPLRAPEHDAYILCPQGALLSLSSC